MGYDAPFAGLKVVDLSQGIAGPYCAMLMAQHGADVIKVEPVEGGDWSRILGTRYADHTAFSIVGNLGKRSIALDLKSDEGKQVLWRLIRGADVFMEGFRPGVTRRLGFGWDAVSAREPRLLYLSVSGFGQTGPLAERPAMDPVLQAYTGFMTENKGEDGIPHRVPVIVIDMATGLYSFQALSAALYARIDEPRGRYIETSLMQTAAALQAVRMMQSVLEGGAQPPGRPPGGVFRTADGWMSITVVKEPDWKRFCIAIDLPAMADEARFDGLEARVAHEAELYAIVRPAIAGRSSDEWAERFTAARIMHERLNNYAAFLQQPQVKETGLIAWLPQPGLDPPAPVSNMAGIPPLVPGTARAHSPACGEHTAAILREHGFTPAEIAELAARKVIAGPAMAREPA